MGAVGCERPDDWRSGSKAQHHLQLPGEASQQRKVASRVNQVACR
jgi:hypothetical protein